MRARTLDPILSNAGVASAYQKDLEKLIDDLFEAYSANIINELMSGEIMADAKPKTPEEIREKFEREAERIARKFVGKSDKHCRAGLINALKKAGYSPADIRKLRQRPADMDAILEQMVAENVALIRNIPEKVQKQIRAMVTKSAENNRDLGGLVEGLKGLKEMTVRRARTISRDQNNKITAQVSILRVQTLGITQGVWMHRSIGKTYRKSHVAMHGKAFDLSAGMWDEDAGEWVLPGQLVNCGCTYKPVLPELNQQPTEPTAETEAEPTQPEMQGGETSTPLAGVFAGITDEKQRQAFAEAHRDAPEQMQQLVAKHGGAFEYQTHNGTRAAFFRPSENKIYIDEKMFPTKQEQDQVRRHEVGHAMDWHLGGGKNDWSDNAFKKSQSLDVKRLVNDDDAVAHIRNALMDNTQMTERSRFVLSGLVSDATRGKVTMTYKADDGSYGVAGHKKSYYTKRGAAELSRAEIFAEFCDIIGSGDYSAMRYASQLLPRCWDVFYKMLTEGAF